MALRKVKGNIERMFDKNLTDLVRGIRNNKNDEVINLFINLIKFVEKWLTLFFFC